MSMSTRYFTWAFGEGQREWPTWEAWHAHWLTITDQPHARYWEERFGYSYLRSTGDMENIRLTNGEETFLLGSIIEDEKGAVHGNDSRGSGYTRCDIGDCDHAEYKPFDAVAWHDDENTETLWQVK